MLAFSGRKYLRAPRGTGALWVRRDWCERLEPATLDARGATWTAPDAYTVHDGARRFELWERDVAGRVGLGVALAQLEGLGIEPVAARVADVAARLRRRLQAVPGVAVHDLGQRLCGIVSFTVAGVDPSTVHRAMRAHDVNISVSRVAMTRLDLGRRGLDAVLRASVHVTTTGEELERFARLVARVARAPGR